MKNILPAVLLLLGLSKALCAAPAEPAGLSYEMGGMGLASLHYRGQSLLPVGEYSEVEVVNWGPRFRRAGGADYDAHGRPVIGTPTEVLVDAGSRRVTRRYVWGKLTCVYGRQGDELTLRVNVANTSADTLLSADVQLLEMLFPAAPTGDTADPGMFGTGGPHPLSDYPLTTDPRETPNVLLLGLGTAGVLDFCGEGVSDPVRLSVPYAANKPAGTRFPFWASVGPIRPGGAQTFAVSLRFGAPGTPPAALARDLYRRYAAAHPFRLRWPDRLPIGTNFLATSEKHPAKNPRGWFSNAADLDVTTPAGVRDFRRRLLAYADASVKVLKDMGAQGVVTWDPEGEEFGTSTYYGDPRLTPRLAPEMEYKDETGVATVDAYFRAFRRAGLRVGVCIRPQQIAFMRGVPLQQDAPDPAETLKAKIAYARRRRGCTLFYVDSTVAGSRVISPRFIEGVARSFPDVLLMPENQTTRYYDCSAPFDSFFHQGVTSTPPGVRAVYPAAFSALYVVGDGQHGTLDSAHDALVAAVRRGDILLFHGWYDADGNAKIKRIYQDARR